ncbi:MAG: hypothetical protein LW595_06330, partial [Rickettsiales bacterium]|nr:hypothetical protein [Rickettsiales bacterium]
MINKLYNFIKKSNNNQPFFSRNYILGANGEILSQDSLTDEEHIKKNTSVATILKKQISIINQCDIIVKEKSTGVDLRSENKFAKEFIKWLNNPNCRPYPVNADQIIKNIIQQHSFYGKAGIIFVFNKEIGISNFEHIQIAKTISIRRDSDVVEYYITCGLSYKQYIFEYDPVRKNYVSKDKNKIMVLCLFENFDVDTDDYVGSFKGVIEYIKLQNYLAKFASSFYANFCVPSSVITITSNNKDIPLVLNAEEQKSFDITIEKIRQEIKGASYQGKAVILNKPNMTIDIKPIQLPANAA